MRAVGTNGEVWGGCLGVSRGRGGDRGGHLNYKWPLTIGTALYEL